MVTSTSKERLQAAIVLERAASLNCRIIARHWSGLRIIGSDDATEKIRGDVAAHKKAIIDVLLGPKLWPRAFD